MPIEILVGRFQKAGAKARRSKLLRSQFETWVQAGGPTYYSRSGMTGFLYAEWALELGYVVEVKLHPERGVLVRFDDGREFE